MSDKQPEDGQIWRYNGTYDYLITDVTPTTCTITKGELADGKWKENKSPSRDYALSEIGKSSWVFKQDLRSECAECNEHKILVPNDFLCEECRALMPVNCRLVADCFDEEAIVVLSGTGNKLDVLKDGSTMISLKREDLPEVAIATLKEFIA